MRGISLASGFWRLGFAARRGVHSLALAATLVLGLPAAEPAPLLPASDVLVRASTLSIDERRYLVYLYARLDKPRVAEALAEEILAAAPGDRQTLLVLASMYLENKDAPATLRIARRFLEHHPGDHQGLYFLGAGHFVAKDFAAANRVLRELKREQFIGRRYPYETDLAASAFSAGDWYRSMLSYQELLRNHDLGDELRADVRQALDGIYREHLPRIDLTVAQTALDLAEIRRYGAVHGRHLTTRRWLDLRYERDHVTLAAAPGLQAMRADRTDIAAELTTVTSRRWRNDVWAGLSGEGIFGGGRLHRVFAQQREASFELAGNVRAIDSLALEALDGRQHHAAIATSWLIDADLVLASRIVAREVHVAGRRFGRGANVDLNLDYTFRRLGPRMTAGYRGSLATFSMDAAVDPAFVAPIADPLGGVDNQQAVLANLVSRRINRHGTGLLVTDNLADAWHYRLTAGVDYDFELSSIAWNGALALTFSPRKSLELTAEAGYTSSASASNAGAAATQLNFFLRSWF